MFLSSFFIHLFTLVSVRRTICTIVINNSNLYWIQCLHLAEFFKVIWEKSWYRQIQYSLFD